MTPDASRTRHYRRRLRGPRRVAAAAAAAALACTALALTGAQVRFTVPRSDLAWWNGHWEVSPGSYALMVGDSSASLPLTAHVEVTG